MLREAIGLVGGFIVMLSYFYTGKKLRIVNVIGSVIFVVYGIMLKAYSLILLNVVATIVHLYYIMKEDK